MRLLLVILLVLSPLMVSADVVVSTRTIRAKQIIGPQDVMLKAIDASGAITDLADLIGQEARVALYPGRPISASDIGPPAIVKRNEAVKLIFDHGALSISTEGRALGRGAAGEVIQVMNLSSRTIVTGRIRSDGQIEVK